VPKWKKDATEFTVGVNLNGVRGYQATIPKPVMEKLDDPKQITFVLHGKKVEVKAAAKQP
jgi:hypothetical protein